MSLLARIVKLMLPVQLRGWSQGSVEEQRARQARNGRFTRLPADIQCRPLTVDGVAAEWIAPPDAGSGVLLYLHGGAYVLGSIDTQRELIARLATASNVRALAVNYRLAPENPYPAALDDVRTAYSWLLAQGVEPCQIILAGDSAGGGLALALLASLRDSGEPLPAGAVCISPWTDLALSGASMQEKAKADRVLDPQSLQKYAGMYAADHALETPYISPLYANPHDFPPLLIQVGADEILLDDALRFAVKARAVGVDVALEVWDGMFHVFQMVAVLPETQEAVANIAEFVTTCLNKAESV